MKTKLFFPLVIVITLVACGTQRPKVDSVADQIAVTAADSETASNTVLRLCGNTVPGGPCRAGALISTRTKENLKERIGDVNEWLDTANRLLAQNDTIGADDRLGRAEAILTVLQAELARYEN